MKKNRRGVDLNTRFFVKGRDTSDTSNKCLDTSANTSNTSTDTSEVIKECLNKQTEDFLELFVQVFINTELDTLTGQRDNETPIEKEEN